MNKLIATFGKLTRVLIITLLKKYQQLTVSHLNEKLTDEFAWHTLDTPGVITLYVLPPLFNDEDFDCTEETGMYLDNDGDDEKAKVPIALSILFESMRNEFDQENMKEYVDTSTPWIAFLRAEADKLEQHLKTK